MKWMDLKYNQNIVGYHRNNHGTPATVGTSGSTDWCSSPQCLQLCNTNGPRLAAQCFLDHETSGAARKLTTQFLLDSSCKKNMCGLQQQSYRLVLMVTKRK